MGVTLLRLRQMTRTNLQEPDDDGRFSSAILDGFINEACFEIADRLDVLVRDDEAEVLAEQAAVYLPINALGVKRVQWNDKALKETTQGYLDVQYPNTNWTTLQGNPQSYYTNTPNIVRLFPIPDEDGVIRVRYAAAPATLEADQDETDLPDFVAALVPLYVTYRAHLTDVDGERRAAYWLQLYEGRLAQVQRALARRTTVPQGFRIRAECRR